MTGPMPGYEAAMIYDAAGKRFIVFGGWTPLGVHTFSLDPVGDRDGVRGRPGGPVFSTRREEDDGVAQRARHQAQPDRLRRHRRLAVAPAADAHGLAARRACGHAAAGVHAVRLRRGERRDRRLVGVAADRRRRHGHRHHPRNLAAAAVHDDLDEGSERGGRPDGPAGHRLRGIRDGVRPGAAADDPAQPVGRRQLRSQTWAYRYPTTGTNPPTTPPPPPAAAPTASITATGTASDTYRFDAVATAASGLTIASYAWTFGDGTSGTGASVTHTYAASGTYTASLTVTDSAGSATTVSKSVTASVPVVTPPPPPRRHRRRPQRTCPPNGNITSFPLPALASAPFSSTGSSKHTNMASDGTRLYVSGGDWITSATDGTWSMSLADGTWRQDVGEPVYPTLPAPHALQDGAGFEWVASRGKFLLWPGSTSRTSPPGRRSSSTPRACGGSTP